jgi:hypothetical protein
MDSILKSRAASLLASGFKGVDFTLIDVGCSGGIDPAWRLFGDDLRAFAFDPAQDEIARLTADETRPKVHYINGFVGLAAGDPRKNASVEPWRLDPWGRLSACHTQDIKRDLAKARPQAPVPADDTPAACNRQEPETEQQLMQANRWHETRLADPDRPIVLPQFLAQKGVDDIDFIKIDVDGTDFEILQSIDAVIASHGVLGMLLEVNFFGSADPHFNTFHNTDRFMRSHGLDLFDLTTRRYSLAALPRPYMHGYPLASQTTGGRAFQGDALYLRDINHRRLDASPAWTDEKLLKLAALFALFGLVDHAAEILILHRERLSAYLDVDAALDAMAAECQDMDGDLWGDERFDNYKAMIDAFQADDPRFYGAEDRRRDALKHGDKDLAAALADAEGQIAHLDSLRTRAEQNAAQAEADRSSAVAELEAMRRTLSWRLTSGLRVLRRRLF